MSSTAVAGGPRASVPSRPLRDVPRWVAVASVILAGAVLIEVQWGSVGPQFSNDEIGNLGNAMLFAHPGTTWVLTGWAYMPGMSVFLTPIWWLTSDPALAYRLAILLCAAVGLAAIQPLAELARRFGSPYRWSFVFASIVVAAPSRALYSNYVWAENLLFLCIAWTVVLVFRLAERPTVANSLAYGAFSAGTFAAHGRALPFAMVAVVVGGAVLWHRRPLAMRVFAAWLLVAVGAYGLFRYATDAIYISGGRESGTLAGLANATPSGYAVTVVSQVWYQVAAWAGLTVIGALTLLARARAERWRGAAMATVVLMAPMALAVPLLLAVPPGGDPRITLHVYGRYLDPFITPLAVIALARLQRHMSARVKALLAVGYAGSAGAFLVWCVPSIPVGGSFTSAHAPGVSYLLHPEYVVTGGKEDWARLVWLAVLPAIVLVVVARLRAVAVVSLSLWFVSVTVWTDIAQFERFEAVHRSEPPIVSLLAGIDTGVPLYAEPKSQFPLQQGNRFAFWLYPRAYVYMDTSKDTSGVQMFLGDVSSTFAREHGASELVGSHDGSAVIWVLPGPLDDQLAKQGRLESPSSN